ncbi:MAG: hypothetical protein WDO71_22875 [Bacteroidota bacterium]
MHTWLQQNIPHHGYAQIHPNTFPCAAKVLLTMAYRLMQTMHPIFYSGILPCTPIIKKLFIGNTAQQSDVQASLSGGDAITQFLLGAGYHSETNVFPGHYPAARGSFHFNLYHSPLSKKWEARLSVIYSSVKNRLFRTDLTRHIILPPHLQLYAPGDKWNWQQGGVNFSASVLLNPLAEMEKKLYLH